MNQDKDTFRGKLFVKFIKNYFKKPLKELKVLDVGCKYGAFSFELAKNFKEVIGIDVNKEALKETKAKAENIKNLKIKEESILKTSFKSNSFDLITMEGVLEWVGITNPDLKAIECQKKALKECKRILKKDGIVYVGIENRLCPYFWLQDPHGKLPLTVILPRFLSKPLYKMIKKSYYGQNILGYWGYKKLFNNIFNNPDIMIPLPHYKYLYEVSSFDNNELRKKIKKVSKIKNLRKTYRWALNGLKISSYLKLTKLFSPNFAIITRKK
ncbi:class I SAM-dependent methyltransferase [Candidatus Woesearchaeota archaeon]|nr:class I SAM-dependent methyltransferase [Candidatus Woesearchaeota archaeon]